MNDFQKQFLSEQIAIREERIKKVDELNEKIHEIEQLLEATKQEYNNLLSNKAKDESEVAQLKEWLNANEETLPKEESEVNL